MAERHGRFEPSPKLLKLVGILLDPDVGGNLTEACRRAGCSRQVWYRAVRRPGFAQWWRRRIVGEAVATLGVTFCSHLRRVVAGSDAAIKLAYVLAGVLDGKGALVDLDEDDDYGGPEVDIELLARIARRLADLGVPPSELGILALLPSAATDALPPQQGEDQGGGGGQPQR